MYYYSQQTYWILLNRMQIYIERNEFDYALTQYLLSLACEDEIWEYYDKLTLEEKHFVYSI